MARTRKTARLARGLFLAVAACFGPAAALGAEAVPGAIPILDTHAHIIRSSRSSPAPEAAIRTMDALGVERAILLPPPFPPGHRGRYGRPELEEVVGDHPGRFAFAAGGGLLNPLIHDVAPESVTRKHLEAFRAAAARIVKSGAAGFGELTAEHFSSGRGNHPYESTPADHPLFLALADVAAEHGMPIDLHMEAVPRDMDMPARMRRSPNPERLKENISGLERLLAHNRKARIVWAHAGWDLTGERTVALMRALLGRHPNLHMSIKLDPRGPRRNAPLALDGGLRPDWAALLREFPDRFLIGSDQFFEEGNDRLLLARRLVDALPAEVARLVASENAKKIYRLGDKPQ